MDQISTYVIILLAVVVVAASFFASVLQNVMLNKLQGALARGEYDEFFKLVDSRLVRMLYPEYNRTYLKLNAYLMEGDDSKVDEILDDLLSRDLPQKQRSDLIVKAFDIYIERGDKYNARRMLKEIDGSTNEEDGVDEETRKNCHRQFDIVIMEKCNHIDEMLQELLGDCDDEDRVSLGYLIALQYKNKGETEMSEAYLKVTEELARKLSQTNQDNLQD